jgi:lipoprotein-releasing system permease protein
MRLLACLALFGFVACTSRPSNPPAAAPEKVVIDPSNTAGSASAGAGSADDPRWVKDPPEVLRAKINGVNAHVVVMKRSASFTEYRDVLGRVERIPGVVAAEPFVITELEIEKAGKPPQLLTLKAVDPARVARVLTVGRHMKTGSLDSLAQDQPPAIVIGDVLASRLAVGIGDEVTVKPRKEPDVLLPVPPTPTVFRVAGTFHLDFDQYDEEFGLASLSAVQPMLGQGDQVMGIEMTVQDLAQSQQIAKVIEHALGGQPYVVMDWYELNKDLFTALGHPRP